jgi:hypothetical protein
MRTYFIIAALMGVFAFGSISLLAHAQDDSAANSMPAPATDEEGMTPAAPPQEEPVYIEEPDPAAVDPKQAAKDKAACKQTAYGRKGGVRDTRTQEERKLEFEDCMSNLGYTAEEIEGEAPQ